MSISWSEKIEKVWKMVRYRIIPCPSFSTINEQDREIVISLWELISFPTLYWRNNTLYIKENISLIKKYIGDKGEDVILEIPRFEIHFKDNGRRNRKKEITEIYHYYMPTRRMKILNELIKPVIMRINLYYGEYSYEEFLDLMQV